MFYKVLKLSQLPNQGIKSVKVNGLALALYNVSGRIFATSGLRTHKECNLSDGFLDGQIVECPCHGGRFDVATGEVKTLPPTIPIKIYKTRIIDKYIEIEA